MKLTNARGGTSVAGDKDKNENDLADEGATAESVDDEALGEREPVAVTRDADGKQSDTVDTTDRRKASKDLRISVSLRTLSVSALIALLLVAVGIMTWLYLGERSKLDAQARQAADNSHAEQIALDYAVNAAKINYEDLNAWKQNLVKQTTPELKDKLNKAAQSMEQILTPLQWNSTATPLTAKVRSVSNGIYVVDAFVGVETKTMQSPDGLQSTATYSVTIDSIDNWEISEVGGIGTVIGQK